jgi:hypothetical protein
MNTPLKKENSHSYISWSCNGSEKKDHNPFEFFIAWIKTLVLPMAASGRSTERAKERIPFGETTINHDNEV